MFDALLLALIVLPVLSGIVLLLGLPQSRGGLGGVVGQGTAWLMLLFIIVLYGLSSISAALPESGTISPFVTFAPDWLSVNLSSLAADTERGWQFALGMDGIAFWLVLLNCIVGLCVLTFAKTTVNHGQDQFSGWMLLAMAGLNLTFLSMDLFSFYIGFELALLPLYPLITKWGTKDAALQAKRFILYSLAGSIPLILGMLGISRLYSQPNEWIIDLPELSRRASDAASADTQAQIWVFVFLVLGFGIKMALIPFHTWMPSTYEASHPTFTAFMAGVVVKLGLFGFLRLAMPLVPHASHLYGPNLLAFLGAVAIVGGALAALAQTDLKRLFAYSSLSHVGFITMGLFAQNEEGISAGIFQMFGHGITTAAVFLTLSCIALRTGSTSNLVMNRNLATEYPKLSFFTIFFLVAGAGMPGLCNFVGEFLALTATVTRQPMIAALGALGIILGAWYTFRFIHQLLFGDVQAHSSSRHQTVSNLAADIGQTERMVLATLAAVCIAMGVFPQMGMRVFNSDAKAISSAVEHTDATTQVSWLSDPSK